MVYDRVRVFGNEVGTTPWTTTSAGSFCSGAFCATPTTGGIIARCLLVQLLVVATCCCG